MKTLKRNIPEFILLILCISLMIGDMKVNPVLISLSLILIALIFTQYKWIGIPLGVVIAFVSLFMMLAVTSEFHEFPKANKEAMTLLTVGLTIFISTLALSVLLVVKYATLKKQQA